MSRIPTTV